MLLYRVLYLRIDNENKCSRPAENHFIVEGRIKEINLPGEVPDLKADEGAVGDVLATNLVGALQEKRFVGGHLVEHHLLYGGLATPTQAHQQNARLHLSTERVAQPQNCIER